jgi:hypothetical protein
VWVAIILGIILRSPKILDANGISPLSLLPEKIKQRLGKWGNGRMGKWENGEMRKWGNGRIGK